MQSLFTIGLRLRPAVFALAAITAASTVHAQTPTAPVAIAGIGQTGYSGDGGPAAAAALNTPSGVAVDAAGDLFIADSYNHRVRKVSRNGTITTIAGSGQEGFAGDGGPAVQAQLDYPTGIAIDSRGVVYFSDTRNNRVRRIDANGTIETVAGTGDAADSGDGGPATAAALKTPGGLALDAAGDLFVADTGNNVVRKISPNGTISTVAGNGSKGNSGNNGPATAAQLRGPAAVAVDAHGNLLISDSGNGLVRRVATDGTITTIAGSGNPFGGAGDNGPATQAAISTPAGVAVDGQGDVFVADAIRGAVRRIDAGGTITTVPGPFAGPIGLAFDGAGNLIVADGAASTVLKVAVGGAVTPGAGTPGSGDLNGDGKTNVTDAVLTLQIAVGAFQPTAAQRLAADLNGDGKVDVRDAILVLRKAIGL